MQIDDQGYERRKRRCGSIVCKCGRNVKLYQTSDAWHRCGNPDFAPLKWRHAEYGDPHGVCECGFAFHGMPDGRMVRIDCREKAKVSE